MLSSSEYYLWEPYVKYRNFILECKNKDYDNSEVLHKHHIIPRHVFVNNSVWNLVHLTVEDHVKAHLLLSDCFEEGSPEKIKLRSNIQENEIFRTTIKILNIKSLAASMVTDDIRILCREDADILFRSAIDEKAIVVSTITKLQ
ncbi:MAG: hypothetical protein EBT39_03910 [Sphingobacteriia bacterium]|nr:hypothetical protein [Candidatus Fonsibacter lacus]